MSEEKLEFIEAEIRRMITNNVIRLRQRLLRNSKTSFRARVARFRKNIAHVFNRSTTNTVGYVKFMDEGEVNKELKSCDCVTCHIHEHESRRFLYDHHI